MEPTDSFYERLGERIRHVRQSKGLRQDQLAQAVGLGRTSISNIERGRQHILVHTLLRIAEYLGVPFSDLVPEPLRPLLPEKLAPFETLTPEQKGWVTTVVSSMGTSGGDSSGKLTDLGGSFGTP